VPTQKVCFALVFSRESLLNTFLAVSASSEKSNWHIPVPPTSPLSTPSSGSATSSTVLLHLSQRLLLPRIQSGTSYSLSDRIQHHPPIIRAHKSPLASLCLNSNGTLLAPSFSKGTVIRGWSFPGAGKLYQFRRGTREVRIWSMNFNLVDRLLAASSERGILIGREVGNRVGRGR